MNDINFRDHEDCTLRVDSYAEGTKRGVDRDYAFVCLMEDQSRSRKKLTVGLTRAQAKTLSTFLIEELLK